MVFISEVASAHPIESSFGSFILGPFCGINPVNPKIDGRSPKPPIAARIGAVKLNCNCDVTFFKKSRNSSIKRPSSFNFVSSSFNFSFSFSNSFFLSSNSSSAFLISSSFTSSPRRFASSNSFSFSSALSFSSKAFLNLSPKDSFV